MRQNNEVEEIVEFTEKSAEFVKAYPACSYIIREVIEKLGNTRDFVLRDLYKFVSEIWDSCTSTVSCGIPLEIQVELIKKLARFLSEAIKNSKNTNEYLKIKIEFEDELQEFWKKTKSSLWKTEIRRIPLSPRDTQIDKIDNKLKKRLLKIIADYRLIFDANIPVFLVRSGYRSFYFINPSYLTLPVYIHENDSKKKIKDFEEFLEELFNTNSKDKKAVTLFVKRFGEDVGTVTWSIPLTELGVPPIIYDLGSKYFFWSKGPIIKRDPQSVNLVIDLTTTGGTARKVIEIIKEEFKKPPSECTILINRGFGILEIDGVKPTTIVNWGDFIEFFRLVPEILRVSISSRIEKLGYVWPSIYPYRNYLREIYLYEKYLSEHKENIIMELCKEFEDKFEEFITQNYELKERDGKFYLFSVYDTEKTKNEVFNYLLTIHTLCWKHIYEKIFGEEDKAYLEKPLEFLLDSLEFDTDEKITVPFLPELLKKKLSEKEYEIPSIDPMDRIHRIFVSNTEEIIGHIDKRLKEIFLDKGLPLGRVITKEQAERMVKGIVNEFIDDVIVKTCEKYGWDHPKYGVEGGREGFVETLPELKKFLGEVFEKIVKKYYKIK